MKKFPLVLITYILLWSCEEPMENQDLDPPSITMQQPIHQSIVMQVLVKRDDQPAIEFENSYIESGKMYVIGKIMPKDRVTTFVSIALSKDASGQLACHVGEEYLDIRVLVKANI